MLKSRREDPFKEWTFLSNHLLVLLALHREPDIRISDLATDIGLTQRAIQKILADLTEASVVEIEKQGRRNRYVINQHRRLRHPLASKNTLGPLLELLG